LFVQRRFHFVVRNWYEQTVIHCWDDPIMWRKGVGQPLSPFTWNGTLFKECTRTSTCPHAVGVGTLDFQQTADLFRRFPKSADRLVASLPHLYPHLWHLLDLQRVIQRTKKRHISSGQRNDPPNADVFLCSAEIFCRKFFKPFCSNFFNRFLVLPGWCDQKRGGRSVRNRICD
jgi:hypothetical protein